MTDWKTLRHQALSDPLVAEEYERLRPQFELASELIKLRKALGLTQRELAELAGVTQPEIARIESGRVAPRWDKVIHLFGSLGASVQIVPAKKKQRRLAPVSAGTGGVAAPRVATGRSPLHKSGGDSLKIKRNTASGAAKKTKGGVSR
jgi:transcriptional regulator with XRE-family HTH domain